MDMHRLRKDIDLLILRVEEQQKISLASKDHERAFGLVRTKLQEAKMWSGKVLEAESKPLPKEFRDHCDERKTD